MDHCSLQYFYGKIHTLEPMKVTISGFGTTWWLVAEISSSVRSYIYTITILTLEVIKARAGGGAETGVSRIKAWAGAGASI